MRLGSGESNVIGTEVITWTFNDADLSAGVKNVLTLVSSAEALTINGTFSPVRQLCPYGDLDADIGG